jgi:hypothetical protein
VLAAALVSAAPASAQSDEPSVSLRPFGLVSGEVFAAKDTFTAVLGRNFEPMWGGGLEVAFGNGVYVDVAASRLSKTGQRAFFANGQRFGLGIPLTLTLTPIEVTAGYRFHLSSSRLVPYVGGGAGSYGYHEESDTIGLSPGEIGAGEATFDKRHVGYLAVGGAEVRLGRWVGVSGDVQYTHVPGIFGTGGVSQLAGEDNLGGLAVRARVIVGR